ncbi:IS110 family transposase [Escherichia albertii]|uniref:IS110 family transposase n=1 Tax=Escherichia albertii TaxID=208962 RepID=UPI0007445006|nr:IS110 family transposase [Escherichia albertii]EEX2837128.1 IS110 family transposase [Escherichia albertii]EJM9606465.1 IS110 family transposase [Escherichia albertii]EJS1738570.1 IS110 family transposase [Escherichia albertii]MCU7292597.1 IS110 family transposase [Escherichia albertii]MCZ8673126.1 IS110 family transposase [Escherichia albertii]
MKYTPVGVDIAKHVIQIHFINENTGEVVDKLIRRQDFLTFFSNREPCLIGMEACGGSQHWARELKKLGHEVRLLQARFVKAFVMGNKNDVMDARAIWMAVQQPGKEIAVKTEEQQSVLVLHRTRRQLVKFRTMQINSLHGTFLEFGETLHKGRAAMDREFPEALERLKERLPPYVISALENQFNRLNELDLQIDDIEKQLTSVAIVAMANKLARTVWAIAAHGRKYDKNRVSIRPY